MARREEVEEVEEVVDCQLARKEVAEEETSFQGSEVVPLCLMMAGEGAEEAGFLLVS